MYIRVVEVSFLELKQLKRNNIACLLHHPGFSFLTRYCSFFRRLHAMASALLPWRRRCRMMSPRGRGGEEFSFIIINNFNCALALARR